MTTQIVLASNNASKLKELHAIFSPYDLEVINQSQLGVTEVEEAGLSFVENAILKARFACKVTNLPCISDDSGLEVLALKGKPGIYSARFCGENATDEKNNQLLIELIKDIPVTQRHARFRCTMIYMRHGDDPSPIIAEGVFEGEIIDHLQGENGFGYDPIFFIPELNKTSAELMPNQKNAISHRALATKKLIKKLIENKVINA